MKNSPHVFLRGTSQGTFIKDKWVKANNNRGRSRLSSVEKNFTMIYGPMLMKTKKETFNIRTKQNQSGALADGFIHNLALIHLVSSEKHFLRAKCHVTYSLRRCTFCKKMWHDESLVMECTYTLAVECTIHVFTICNYKLLQPYRSFLKRIITRVKHFKIPNIWLIKTCEYFLIAAFEWEGGGVCLKSAFNLSRSYHNWIRRCMQVCAGLDMVT